MKIHGFYKSLSEPPCIMVPVFVSPDSQLFFCSIDEYSRLASFLPCGELDKNRIIDFYGDIDLEIGASAIYMLEITPEKYHLVDINSVSQFLRQYGNHNETNLFSVVELANFCGDFNLLESSLIKAIYDLKTLDQSSVESWLSSPGISRSHKKYVQRYFSSERALRMEFSFQIRGADFVVREIEKFCTHMKDEGYDIVEEAINWFSEDFILRKDTRYLANIELDIYSMHVFEFLKPNLVSSKRIDSKFQISIPRSTFDKYDFKTEYICDNLQYNSGDIMVYNSIKNKELANMYMLLKYIVDQVPEFDEYMSKARDGRPERID